MYGLSALPVLAMGCFGDVLGPVCNRSAKLVDRSVISSGAVLLAAIVPRAVDRLVELGSKKVSAVRKSVSELCRVLDMYRHSYTVNLLARVLKGVEKYSSVLESCREAAYVAASRLSTMGEEVAEAVLTMLDADVLLVSALSRSSIARMLRALRVLESEAVELERSLSMLSTITVVLAEAWSRGRKVFGELLKLLSSDMRKHVEDIDVLLDTIAIAIDPENEYVARELLGV